MEEIDLHWNPDSYWMKKSQHFNETIELHLLRPCCFRLHLKLWLVFDLSPGMQQQVDKALSLIGKKFKDLDLTNLYAPPPPPLTLPSLPMTSWVRMGSLAAFSHS